MDSKRNRRGAQIMVWGVFLVALIVAGCQFILPRQEWSSKKWGPLVPHKNFPGDCSICHLPERWDKLRDDFHFDHEKETGYKLEGAHAGAACLRCHNDRGPVEAYVARGCSGCHVDPHADSLGMDCERCHSQISWEPQGLVGEHARTRFPLSGSHVIAACESCHAGAPAGEFRGAPLQCEACHQAALAQATNPDHVANGWVSDCQRCHNPSTWNNANVDHSFFPLVGGHGGLDCTQCHTTPGSFAGLSQDCYSCHSSDFSGAPDHVAQNYPHDCTQCHRITGWTPAVVDHSFFPLSAGHSGLSCNQCHSGGTFTGLSTDCYSCHSSDFSGAPDHLAQNYPHDCTQCHKTTGWTPAVVDHSSFPLTAGHSGLSCNQCHSGGTYTGQSTACYSCHSANFQTAPDHVAQNYSHDCSRCHNTSDWSQAVVDHSFFPLTAGHSGLTCNQCHSGGTYTGLSQDCYSCHQSDFQAAPDHANLGFPHDCTACHSSTAWTPASFQHDFPLRGDHNVSCATCHDSGSTQSFNCLGCHAHSQSRMDSEHGDRRNYSYNSSACYNCHPDGRD